MNRLLGRIVGSAPLVVLTLAVLVGTPTRSHAQYMGYGGYGMGGYGMGGYGMGGYGMGGYGMGGYGMGGYGMGGYGYPNFGYGMGFYPSYGYTVVGSPVPIYPNGYPLLPAYNPLFGLGLSPLGVQSALAERSLIRASSVSRGYGGVSGPIIRPNTSYGNGGYTPYPYTR